MTAIKPIESRLVRAVASERYPLNKVCSHPECAEPAVDPHHAFPRSAIGGDSWFVEVTIKRAQPIDGGEPYDYTIIIPHVTGTCREHHDLYESRTLWLRWNVEGDGLWTVWEHGDPQDGVGDKVWVEVGPLNPQPGSAEGKPKKRKRFQGEARRKRRTISIRVPNDTENGGELWDEMIHNVEGKLIKEGLYSEGDQIPAYEALMAAVNDWLTD